MSEEQEEMDFETLLRHLEEVVTRLEGGELTLEASLKDYEQGVLLVRAAQARLNAMNARLEELLIDGDVADFEVDDEEDA